MIQRFGAPKLVWGWLETCLITAVLLLALFALPAIAQTPPLPPGLEEPETKTEEPALPPGHEEPEPQSEEPALPPGLEESEPEPEAEEPALPPGLDAPSTEPALPPGLESETETPAESGEEAQTERFELPFGLRGFWETRAGLRVLNDDAHPSDATVAETRLQLETEYAWERAVIDVTADFYLDGVLEQADFDLRQLRLTWTPLDNVDIRLGRQILTWGTGDLLFINDLFPKDWQSFLIGRDVEYLKAPSDALKVGWFTDWVNIDFVYTPQFAPDRYVSGEYLSYYQPLFRRRVGPDWAVDANPPSTWFQDDEFAWRIYKNIKGHELALYGYSGYWKSPAGQRLNTFQATFPKLSVYGASWRAAIGKGIANLELGYYDSRQDRGGGDPFVNNSEFRLLMGYERELAKDFTGAFQYYLEHMMDYGEYRDTLIPLIHPRDENRHLLTMRLTKLLMNQNLTLSLFTYYSPSDNDAFVLPRVSYKVTDRWTVEAGANLFFGESDWTFFGQFQNDSGVFASARYAF